MQEINDIKVEVMTESTCRLCLTDSENSQLIFDSDSGSLDVWIEDIISLKYNNIPNAPASLCCNCKKILENFEEFRNKGISNNNILNKLFVCASHKNELCRSNNSSMDDTVQNTQKECVVSNFTEMIESTHPDPLQTSIEIVKIEIEENFSNLTNQVEALIKEPAQPTNKEEAPKVRGQKQCPVCNKYVGALGKHILTLHKDYKPFQCEYCARRFNIQENMLKHIRRHLQLKSYICQYCNKAFNNAGELKVHIRVHTNEKPYPCTECGRSFKTSGTLGRHKLAHSGFRPHECEICHAKFYTTGHLKRHMTVHTLERAYSCKICNKKFTRPEATKVTAHKCIKS